MTYRATKIKDNIWWVGAIDWNLRNFHGYITPRGSTYNAYLILDEKNVLIDTVKKPFSHELLERISSVVSLDKIHYVIANHVEMDHSGSLPELKKALPNAKFVADKRATEDLNRHFKEGWDFQIVKTSDNLSIGKRTLTFVEVPMVHWPDSMVTFCPEEKILFSNDAFGQHIASHERFDNQLNWENIHGEAAKYYANIVFPFAGPATKALDAISKIDVEIIAPSHGIIWRENINKIISCYKDWASNKTKTKAVIVYDTMWNSTELMARAIGEGLSKKGVDTRLFNMRVSDISEVIKEILEAKAIIVGSPTLNNGMMPTISSFLTYLKGLKPKNRIGFAFGSFGWAGGSTQAIEAELKATGIEILREPISMKYIPDPSEVSLCHEAGTKFAEQMKGK